MATPIDDDTVRVAAHAALAAVGDAVGFFDSRSPDAQADDNTYCLP
jgi:hypothetical protein